MALTLDDINRLPNDPTPEHLVSLGLLPAPEPPPSIIPKATVPATTAVTPAAKAADWIHGVGPYEGGPSGAFRIGTGIGKDAAQPTTEASAGDWKAKLSGTLSHPHATPLSPLPAAPEIGTPGIVPSPDSARTPLGSYSTLPHLNFKERQALPTFSEGVPEGSSGQALAELSRMQDQNRNPWGSAENHPGLLGKIGHYAARIGNIAGNIVAPATMANIPGTQLNREEKERELQATTERLGKEEEAKRTGESERELRSAEAEEARARAAKLGGGTSDILQDAAGNAVGWRDEKGAMHSLDEEGTPPAIKAIADKWQGKEAAKPQKQNMEQGLAGAVQEAIDAGRDPKDDPAVQRWAQAIKDYKPTKDTDVKTAEDLKHRIVVAMESGDMAEAKRLQAQLMATDPEGMARLADAQARMAETAADRTERKEERQEKQGLKWVTGETADGKTVTVPYSQAQTMGLKNQAEANSDHVNKVLAARVVVPMLFNTDPNDAGVIQIVNELDKEGKLGPLASRWNDFMARKWGAGDPLYAALLTRLDLTQTKMMQAHVGSRGGAWMLEHFEDLANARKLDAPTLRATLDQELRYMARNSERPPASSVPAAGSGKSGHTFSVNGKKYENVPDDVYERAKKKPGFKE